MPDPRFAKVAQVLEQTAKILDRKRTLDPDGAVREAVWGNSEARIPEHQTPDGDLYDEAASLIECWIADNNGHDPGNGIQCESNRDGHAAAVAEAKRYRKIAARSR